MKVIIFDGNDAEKLEASINEWFVENSGIKVFQVLQSESTPGDNWWMTISIFYEETK